MDTLTEFPAFKIKDIALAELGRKEISLAEAQKAEAAADPVAGHADQVAQDRARGERV